MFEISAETRTFINIFYTYLNRTAQYINYTISNTHFKCAIIDFVEYKKNKKFLE